MPPWASQPDAADAAHWRLLADVVVAPPDAGAIVLACGAVRHAAIAAAQDRRPRGRVEIQADGSPTQRLP